MISVEFASGLKADIILWVYRVCGTAMCLLSRWVCVYHVLSQFYTVYPLCFMLVSCLCFPVQFPSGLRANNILSDYRVWGYSNMFAVPLSVCISVFWVHYIRFIFGVGCLFLSGHTRSIQPHQLKVCKYGSTADWGLLYLRLENVILWLPSCWAALCLLQRPLLI